MGSTRELNTVENKPKKVKLVSYNIPGPIKTTQLESNNESSNLELNNHSLSKNGVTAIVAVIKAGPKFRPENNGPKPSKKRVPKKIIRILLDSGSDGDLMFHKKGTSKSFPYLTRQTPKSWGTSNGTFHTNGKGSIEVNFFEYSKSKAVLLTPEIVEYDEKTLAKPAFDLIIGTKTMTELGIILDFKYRVITVDEIKLPMQNIKDLPASNKKAL